MVDRRAKRIVTAVAWNIHDESLNALDPLNS
jgi:hypothetical protein